MYLQSKERVDVSASAFLFYTKVRLNELIFKLNIDLRI